jgi:hypothetical protein
MTDHFARPKRAASSERVAELHRLCAEDYAAANANRQPVREPLWGAAADTIRDQLHEPTDLDSAIRVAQQLLDSDQILPLREALRLLLRALGVAARPAITRHIHGWTA